MKTVWKFPIPPTTPFTLDLPKGAELLCVQVQGGKPNLWARVDPEEPAEARTFHVVDTGAEVPPRAYFYVGTFQVPAAPGAVPPTLVFHVFEEAREYEPFGED